MNAAALVAPREAFKVKPRVLVVDDDLETTEQLSMLLQRDGYVCERAASGSEALQIFERSPFDVVISDVKMAGMSGLDLLDRLVETHPVLPVILCTGFGALAGAVDAIKRGAFQYLAKPYAWSDLREILASAIPPQGGMTQVVAGRQRRSSPRTVAATVYAGDSRMLGDHPTMLALQQGISSVAASSPPVFISGESGTGKDLVARAIHAASARKNEAFVAVNVSAIPEHLLESELFGHVRGAFTGANEARRGLLVEAHEGTLFLDEIGDMPMSLQAKLLRVLQFGEVRPVGSDSARRVDVRIVAATHRDLPKLIEAGRFREDLYYRIHVLPIHVPALRERSSDIALLARHFLAQSLQRAPTSPVRTLSPQAEQALGGAAWPGNVRELEATMERLVVFGREGTIDIGDLAFMPLQRANAGRIGELRSLREMSESHVQDVLTATGGDKRRAALILGIDLSTLYRWKQRLPTV